MNLRTYKRNLKLVAENPRLVPRIIKNYYRVLTSKERFLKIILAATYDCQLKCKHCYAADYKVSRREIMNLNDYKKLIEEANNLGVVYFNICGGEPLLNPHICEIVSMIRSKGMIANVSTNGFFADENMIKKLRAAGLSFITFGILSYDEKEHDSFAGVKGAYKKAMNGVILAKKCGMTVAMTFPLTPEVIKSEGFIQLMKFTTKINVCLDVTLPSKMGGWKDKDIIMEKEDLNLISKIIRPYFVNVTDQIRYFNFLSKNIQHICLAGEEKLYVTPYGDVTPCPVIQISFGNIKKEPLGLIARRIQKSSLLKNGKKYGPFCQSQLMRKEIIDPINRCRLPVFYKKTLNMKNM